MQSSSAAYDKGRAYEQHIAKLIRRKADGGSKRNNGSHANWHRRSDIFTNLPLHIEAKHHETIRLKDWMEQAEAAKSFTETAVVAFRMDEQDYACLNLEDLLNLFAQIADLQAEVEDLRQPISHLQMPRVNKEQGSASARINKDVQIKPVVEQKVERGAKLCKNGHIVDDYGYCLQSDCKYARGYRPQKGKK